MRPCAAACRCPHTRWAVCPRSMPGASFLPMHAPRPRTHGIRPRACQRPGACRKMPASSCQGAVMARTIPIDESDAARREPGRGWQIAWGVLLIVAGVLAVLMPGIAALATVLVYAWLLILSGAFEL